jgi:hypothetical protein
MIIINIVNISKGCGFMEQEQRHYFRTGLTRCKNDSYSKIYKYIKRYRNGFSKRLLPYIFPMLSSTIEVHHKFELPPSSYLKSFPTPLCARNKKWESTSPVYICSIVQRTYIDLCQYKCFSGTFNT